MKKELEIYRSKFYVAIIFAFSIISFLISLFYMVNFMEISIFMIVIFLTLSILGVAISIICVYRDIKVLDIKNERLIIYKPTETIILLSDIEKVIIQNSKRAFDVTIITKEQELNIHSFISFKNEKTNEFFALMNEYQIKIEN
ncbi:MAG: hypothetical protein J6K52_06800 [Clostridia bacterium]|nr:hypothetical protein [Clostridia bacterium]MBQ7789604.1 hypothetical protein [Clostridia bacterium]